MCGIAGLVGPDADTSEGRAWLASTLEALAVRGPDDVRTWTADGAALGHRRLAIRDLSPAGAQPMASTDGDTVIVYNGELYDTRRLVRPLTEGGWRPRGHSDTEILLEHIVTSGVLDGTSASSRRALDELVGMFAFGAWNAPTRSLTLARDKVGIKPLYYAETRHGLAFCSEPVPLGFAPGVARILDPEALHWFLCLGMIPAPWSLNQSVRQLLPGHLLRWTAQGGAKVERWGEMPRPTAPGDRPASPVGRADLQRLILDVVKDQMVSDVPLGVLLSGGVDSSVVAAAAARNGRHLNTFSVVHPEPEYDERDAARAVARHLGTTHHELELSPAGLTEDELTELVTRTGDPFADSSALPMRRLSSLIREHVTVALSGDGGDEIFAGYPRYTLANQLRRLGRVPRLPRRALVRAWKLADRRPGSSRSELSRRLARAARLSLRPGDEQALGTVSYMFPDEVRQLVRPHLRCDLEHADLVRARLNEGAPPSPDAWFLHLLEQRLVLPDTMLVKVDRTSMGASLEVRPPLLDDRIVAAAARVPFDQKVRGREAKAILKDIARAWVPPEVVDRPKKGFAVPLLSYGGPVMADAGRWALESSESPLRAVFTTLSLARLASELESPPRGRTPEDSAFRLVHRRWLLILLARAMAHQGLEVS